MNKGANYNTKLSNPTKLIVKCDDDGCAWRCRATSILASKKWEIRKLHEPHTCSNPAISQGHVKLSYMLISKSIRMLINNYRSTSVPTLIAHVKSTEGYTMMYRKTWLAKQKTIENIYDN